MSLRLSAILIVLGAIGFRAVSAAGFIGTPIFHSTCASRATASRYTHSRLKDRLHRLVTRTTNWLNHYRLRLILLTRLINYWLNRLITGTHHWLHIGLAGTKYWLHIWLIFYNYRLHVGLVGLAYYWLLL